MAMKSLASLKTNVEKVELFEVSPSKTILWNHEPIGTSSKLHFAFHQKPIVNVKERALQDAVRYLESTPSGTALCYFSGSLKCGDGSTGSGITLYLKKFEENVEFPLFDVAYAPVMLSKKTKRYDWESRHYLKDLEALKENCGDVPEVLPKNFFQWRLSCSSMGINCDVKIELISVSLTFIATPLNNLPVLASELTEYLTKNKNALHTGLVTMTKEKQFLLVPEDHLGLPSLPLVGIWVSGVPSIYHPLVWSACVHYISSTLYIKRLCLPPIPFLLILYQKDEEYPDFYDCLWNNGNIFPKYVLHEGIASTSLPKVPIYDSRSLCVELEKVTPEKSSEFLQAVKHVKKTEISPSYFNIVMSADDVSPKVQPEPVPDIPNLNNIMEKDDYSMLVKTDSDIFDRSMPDNVFHKSVPLYHAPHSSSSSNHITHNSCNTPDYTMTIPKASSLYSHYRNNFPPQQFHEPNTPSPNYYHQSVPYGNSLKRNVFFAPSPPSEDIVQRQRTARQTINSYPGYTNCVGNQIVSEQPINPIVQHFNSLPRNLSTNRQFNNMQSPSEYFGVPYHARHPNFNQDDSYPMQQHANGPLRTQQKFSPDSQHNTRFEFPSNHPPGQNQNVSRYNIDAYAKHGITSDYKNFYEDIKRYYPSVPLNTLHADDDEHISPKNIQTHLPGINDQYNQQPCFSQTSVPVNDNLHPSQSNCRREAEVDYFKGRTDNKEDAKITSEQYLPASSNPPKNIDMTNHMALSRTEISRIPVSIQRGVAISPEVMYIDNNNTKRKDLPQNVAPKKSCLKKMASHPVISTSRSCNSTGSIPSSEGTEHIKTSKNTFKPQTAKKPNFKTTQKSEELNVLETNKKSISSRKSPVALRPSQNKENNLINKQKMTVVGNNNNERLRNKSSTTINKQNAENIIRGKDIENYSESKNNKADTNSVHPAKESSRQCENCGKQNSNLCESTKEEFQHLENKTNENFPAEVGNHVKHLDKSRSENNVKEIAKVNANDNIQLYPENMCRRRDDCGEFSPSIQLNEMTLPCQMLIKIVEEQGKRITDLANLMFTHINNSSFSGTYDNCRKPVCNHDAQTDSNQKTGEASTPKYLNSNNLPHLNVSPVNDEHLAENNFKEKHMQAIKKTCTVATVSECHQIDVGTQNVETFSHISSVCVQQIIQVTKDSKVEGREATSFKPANKLQAKQCQGKSPGMAAECSNTHPSALGTNEHQKTKRSCPKANNVKENVDPNSTGNVSEQNHLHDDLQQMGNKTKNFCENTQDHRHINPRLSLPDAMNEEIQDCHKKRHSDSGVTVPKVVIPTKNASLPAEIEHNDGDRKRNLKLKHLPEQIKRKPAEKERKKKKIPIGKNEDVFSSERFSPSTQKYLKKYNLSGHSPALSESSSEEDLGNVLMKLASS